MRRGRELETVEAADLSVGNRHTTADSRRQDLLTLGEASDDLVGVAEPAGLGEVSCEKHEEIVAVGGHGVDQHHVRSQSFGQSHGGTTLPNPLDGLRSTGG